MSKLDKILVPSHEVRTSRTYAETKEEIKKLFLELIGEDDYLSSSSARMTHWQHIGANDVRQQFRKKVERL